MIEAKTKPTRMRLKCDGPHKWKAPQFRVKRDTYSKCVEAARDAKWMFHRNSKVSCPRCVKSGAARLTGYVEKTEEITEGESNVGTQSPSE